MYCGPGGSICAAGSWCHNDADGFGRYAVCCPGVAPAAIGLGANVVATTPAVVASGSLYASIPAPAVVAPAAPAVVAGGVYAAAPAVPLYTSSVVNLGF